MKICSKCRTEKLEEEFPFLNEKSTSRCKECIREYAREHHKKNKEKANAKRKEYYHKNKERELEKQKERYWENWEEIRKRANEQNRTPERREKARIRGLNWAKNNPEKYRANANKWKRNNPEKAKAHLYVQWALKLEVIQRPEECKVCKRKIKVEAHHYDYSKPLEIEWLCRLCHLHRHNKLLDHDPRIKNDSTCRQYIECNSD